MRRGRAASSQGAYTTGEVSQKQLGEITIMKILELLKRTVFYASFQM